MKKTSKRILTLLLALTLLALPFSSVALATNTNLNVIATNVATTTATVDWDKVYYQSSGWHQASYYKVEIKTTSQGSPYSVVDGYVTGTSLNLTGLTPDTNYIVKVTAYKPHNIFFYQSFTSETEGFKTNPIQYTINTANVGNGSALVNGSTSITVDEGTGLNFTYQPGSGSYFIGWDVDPLPLTATSNGTYTATFGALVTTSVNVSENNGGTATVSAEGGTQLAQTVTTKPDDLVTIVATPFDEYYFVEWDDHDTNPTRTFPAGEGGTYTATFAQKLYSISVINETPNGGFVATVNGQPLQEGQAYPKNTVVDVTAYADYSYSVQSLSVGLSSFTGNTLSYSINGDTEIVIHYQPESNVYNYQYYGIDGSFNLARNETLAGDISLDEHFATAKPGDTLYVTGIIYGLDGDDEPSTSENGFLNEVYIGVNNELIPDRYDNVGPDGVIFNTYTLTVSNDVTPGSTLYYEFDLVDLFASTGARVLDSDTFEVNILNKFSVDSQQDDEHVQVSGTGDYYDGDMVHLTFTPDDHTTIDNIWVYIGEDEPFQLEPNEDGSFTYHIEGINDNYYLVVESTTKYSVDYIFDDAHVLVNGGNSFMEGQNATFSVVPDEHTLIDNVWIQSGDSEPSKLLPNEDGTYSILEIMSDYKVTIDSTTSFTVVVTTSNDQAGSVTLGGSNSYKEGTVLTVTATPNGNYVFNNWNSVVDSTNTIVSNNSSYTFTVTEDLVLIANFTFVAPSNPETPSNPTTPTNDVVNTTNTVATPSTVDEILIDQPTPEGTPTDETVQVLQQEPTPSVVDEFATLLSDDFIDNSLPQGGQKEALPQTGGLPAEVLYLLGSGVIGLGFSIKKKIK